MVTRGFEGSRRAQSDRVPPGQYVVEDFPVLTAGPTQHIPESEWALEVTDGTASRSYDWSAFHGLEFEEIEVDIHCVTRWSKRGTKWLGVPVAALMEDAGVADLPYAAIGSYGDYVTNLPTEDLLADGSMVATQYDGEPIEAEHGGPARLLVPHLYLWKSAKWLRQIRFREDDAPGFWESAGYHNYGDPWQEQRYYND